MGTVKVLLTHIQKLETITFWYLQNSCCLYDESWSSSLLCQLAQLSGWYHPVSKILLKEHMKKHWHVLFFALSRHTHQPTHLSPTTVNSFKSTGPEFAKKIHVLLNFLSFTHHCDLENCTSYESVKPLWRWPSWKVSNIREKVTFRPFSKLLVVL